MFQNVPDFIDARVTTWPRHFLPYLVTTRTTAPDRVLMSLQTGATNFKVIFTITHESPGKRDGGLIDVVVLQCSCVTVDMNSY